MKRLRRIVGMAGLACMMLGGSAMAQTPPVTAQTLVDRAQIVDMLTRYITDLGRAGTDSYAASYTEDAELILGGKSYRGHAGVASAYAAARANPDNTRGKAYAFNVLLSNPLIVVRGDTATAQFIFTEVLTDTPQSAPHILVQGREYDELARVNGQWLFRKRQIVGGTTPPAGWRP